VLEALEVAYRDITLFKIVMTESKDDEGLWGEWDGSCCVDWSFKGLVENG
jgi:hypothetical protein